MGVSLIDNNRFNFSCKILISIFSPSIVGNAIYYIASFYSQFKNVCKAKAILKEYNDWCNGCVFRIQYLRNHFLLFN